MVVLVYNLGIHVAHLLWQNQFEDPTNNLYKFYVLVLCAFEDKLRELTCHCEENHDHTYNKVLKH
jgi:hypothetical protein